MEKNSSFQCNCLQLWRLMREKENDNKNGIDKTDIHGGCEIFRHKT